MDSVLFEKDRTALFEQEREKEEERERERARCKERWSPCSVGRCKTILDPDYE